MFLCKSSPHTPYKVKSDKLINFAPSSKSIVQVGFLRPIWNDF